IKVAIFRLTDSAAARPVEKMPLSPKRLRTALGIQRAKLLVKKDLKWCQSACEKAYHQLRGQEKRTLAHIIKD
ncbi:hypothetical protein DK750_10475, partial [Salmonella enterica subsp. enterica serovar Rovaniemi]|nr:hypothetical protein [Salmonella enterica subsp. enterica serovar Rovaniemi]